METQEKKGTAARLVQQLQGEGFDAAVVTRLPDRVARAQMREAGDDCSRHARVSVDTDEALQKSGDLIGPLSHNVISPADLNGTLAALCRGDVRCRLDGSERTVFKAVGTVLEYLAPATQVYEKHI